MKSSATRYRIIVGEVGSETGHIVDTAAMSERGARRMLHREMVKYSGDVWGRIEIDIYGDGRWMAGGIPTPYETRGD